MVGGSVSRRRRAPTASEAVACTGECDGYAWQKLIMVGSTNTGKSSIRTRLSGDNFPEVCASTVLLKFATWCPTLDDKELRVEIMDMAGRERFRSHVRDYYRRTNFYVIVYSVTEKTTFEDGVKDWLEELMRHEFSGRQPRFLLLGKKCDRHRSIECKGQHKPGTSIHKFCS